ERRAADKKYGIGRRPLDTVMMLEFGDLVPERRLGCSGCLWIYRRYMKKYTEQEDRGKSRCGLFHGLKILHLPMRNISRQKRRSYRNLATTSDTLFFPRIGFTDQHNKCHL